jgi:hypothetical protein
MQPNRNRVLGEAAAPIESIFGALAGEVSLTMSLMRGVRFGGVISLVVTLATAPARARSRCARLGAFTGTQRVVMFYYNSHQVIACSCR